MPTLNFYFLMFSANLNFLFFCCFMPTLNWTLLPSRSSAVVRPRFGSDDHFVKLSCDSSVLTQSSWCFNSDVVSFTTNPLVEGLSTVVVASLPNSPPDRWKTRILVLLPLHLKYQLQTQIVLLKQLVSPNQLWKAIFIIVEKHFVSKKTTMFVYFL